MKPLLLFTAGLSFMVSVYAQIPAPFSNWQQVNDPKNEQEIVLVNPQDIQPVQGQPHLRQFRMRVQPFEDSAKQVPSDAAADFLMTLNCQDNTLRIDGLELYIEAWGLVPYGKSETSGSGGEFTPLDQMSDDPQSRQMYQTVRRIVCD
ncbi:hypothetical protein [Saezia sanguinis]|uniref:hypothetical protein n=1 Tax=Saezia sanguinis TaxID=1965230 RepID=UPI0030585DA1